MIWGSFPAFADLEDMGHPHSMDDLPESMPWLPDLDPRPLFS